MYASLAGLEVGMYRSGCHLRSTCLGFPSTRIKHVHYVSLFSLPAYKVLCSLSRLSSCLLCSQSWSKTPDHSAATSQVLWLDQRHHNQFSISELSIEFTLWHIPNLLRIVFIHISIHVVSKMQHVLQF